MIDKAVLPSYFCFLFLNRRLLVFGLLTAMLSVFGQTYFIGLFNPYLREVSGLAQGELGLVYGGATILSATLLTWLGGLYDRVNPRLFVSLTMLLLALGCMLLGFARSTLALLLALFILRLSGQGLMVHISLTTMARRYHQARGKAVSIAALGMPLAEAAFPAIAIAALVLLEWRQIWLAGAAFVMLLLPLIIWLLDSKSRDEPLDHNEQTKSTFSATRGQVLRDWRFVMLLPAALSSAFVATIVFFYQIPIVEAKGWGSELVASGLAFYALGHVVGLFISGGLVDQFTAGRVFVPALFPMLLSILVLVFFHGHWAAMLWPAILGLGQGIHTTAMTSLLAERYGLAHLGAIRAMLQAMVVLSTAVGPPLFGSLLDLGIHAESLVMGIAAGIGAAILMAMIALAAKPKYRESSCSYR